MAKSKASAPMKHTELKISPIPKRQQRLALGCVGLIHLHTRTYTCIHFSSANSKRSRGTVYNLYQPRLSDPLCALSHCPRLSRCCCCRCCRGSLSSKQKSKDARKKERGTKTRERENRRSIVARSEGCAAGKESEREVCHKATQPRARTPEKRFARRGLFVEAKSTVRGELRESESLCVCGYIRASSLGVCVHVCMCVYTYARGI